MMWIYNYFYPMRQIIVISLIFLAVGTALSQSKKNSRPSEPEKSFFEKTWYGSSIALGFGTDYFAVGLAPMAGYKFLDWLSGGPRVEINYFHLRGYGTDNRIHNVNVFSGQAGLFTRAKVARVLFAQLEYARNRSEYPISGFNGILSIEDGEVLTETESRNKFFIGAGYSSGREWKYEISLMYDLLAPKDVLNVPIEYRAGITYNF